MSFELPSHQRPHLADIDRETRRGKYGWEEMRLESLKLAYLVKLESARKLCGETLWAELKERRQAWKKAEREYAEKKSKA